MSSRLGLKCSSGSWPGKFRLCMNPETESWLKWPWAWIERAFRSHDQTVELWFACFCNKILSLRLTSSPLDKRTRISWSINRVLTLSIKQTYGFNKSEAIVLNCHKVNVKSTDRFGGNCIALRIWLAFLVKYVTISWKNVSVLSNSLLLLWNFVDAAMRSISDNADITKNRLLPFVDVFQLSPCDPMNTINKFEVFTSLMELRLIVVDGIWGSSDTTAG